MLPLQMDPFWLSLTNTIKSKAKYQMDWILVEFDRYNDNDNDNDILWLDSNLGVKSAFCELVQTKMEPSMPSRVNLVGREKS